jgi:nicotinate-nucleotide--dimethylbenzimidazole phosphoribosyltransferase
MLPTREEAEELLRIGHFSINKIRVFNQKIETPSAEIYAQIKQNWDGVAKPLDGLGEFEHLLARIGSIGGSSRIDIGKKAIIAMCADNGVVAEGVSQSGQEVTAIVTSFMGQNRTSVGKMASHIGAEVIPVDIGINGDDRFEGVLERKVRRGTRDFLLEPAMTEEEALQAIETGIELVGDCKKNGYRLLGTGEMGIGNTTTSSALAAVLLECPVEEVTGRGAGLSDEGLVRKKDVIREALAKYQLGIYREQGANSVERKQDATVRQEETLRALCCVGGLDIAGLVGVYIGGAVYHIPVVMDGLISMVAALVAERLVPGVKEYLIPSHMGKEPAARRLAEALGVRPVIHAGLALGEGTGAVMMFSLLDIALTLYAEQTTFSDIAVEQYERFDG